MIFTDILIGAGMTITPIIMDIMDGIILTDQ